jgi:anaerobic magnesium-protoporphyrin IX monomethyl ester cyclase
VDCRRLRQKTTDSRWSDVESNPATAWPVLERAIMRVTLVDPASTADPTLGLGYLASFLHKTLNKVSVTILETDRNVAERIVSTKPDIVGFTTVTANYTRVAEAVRNLKSRCDVPVILGGPHVTALPESLVTGADAAVVGEGELTLVELVELYRAEGGLPHDKLAGIDGIAFWSGGRLIKTNVRQMLQPLDLVPFPDRDLYDMRRYLRPAMRDGANYVRATTQLSARGCPYKCVFCHPSLVWRKIRLFSPEYVAEEVDYLVTRYGVQAVLMSDDLFVMDPARIERLIELLGRRGILGRIKFFCETRPNLVTEWTVKLLKELNVIEVALGIESASPRILKYLKRGGVSVEGNWKAVDLIHSHGMNVYAFVMIGSPTETEEEMIETLKFVSDPRVTRFSVAITTPFPGTELWDYALDKGLVSIDMDWRRIFAQPVAGRPRPVYLNDETVPWGRFLEIYSMFEDAKNFKWVNRTLANLSWRHLGHLTRRVASDPRSLGRLARRVGRHLSSAVKPGKAQTHVRPAQGPQDGASGLAIGSPHKQASTRAREGL